MEIIVKDSAKDKNWGAALKKAKSSKTKSEGSACGVFFKRLANSIILL
jgi:hypothetical protein